MGLICFLMVVGVIGYIVFKIKQSVDKSNQIERSAIEAKVTEMRKALLEFDNKLSDFFTTNSFIPYKSTYDELVNIISKLNGLNDALKSKTKEYDFKNAIRERQKLMEKFLSVEKHLDEFPWSNMIIDDAYGTVNKEYLDAVKNLNREDTDLLIQRYSLIFSKGNIGEMLDIDYDQLVLCIWFYAITKPYSAEQYKKAVSMFKKAFKWSFIDLTLTELYTLKQVGSEELLQNKVREIIKYYDGSSMKYDQYALTACASFLMWIQAYRSESIVLQYMLSKNIQMSSIMQERLHSLLNGLGDSPVVVAVTSEEDRIYFDVSSLTWKEKEISGLFENLAFQEKTLTYSLAMRSDDKILSVPKGFKLPSLEVIESKIAELFIDEYEQTANVKKIVSSAIAGNNEEKMDCILCRTDECKQLGILVNIAQIGKKLNIKFYTIFMPQGTLLQEQRQQAIAMKNELSPIVTMWENGLSETVLTAIQQLLNTNVQNSGESGEDINSKEIQF